MGRRAATWLAWFLCALCGALAVLAVGLDFYTAPTRHEPDFSVLAGIPLLVYPTIGALVVSHRPKNAVGWILCGMGFVFEVLAFSRAYADYLLFAHPGSLIGKTMDDGAAPWTVGHIVIMCAVLLVVLFPDGRLPVRYFRGVVWMAVGGTALASLSWFTWSEEIALGRFVIMLRQFVFYVGLFGITLIFLSCAASVFAILERLQRAEARERQQIKWFGYGAAVFLSADFFLLFADEQTSEWLVFAVIVVGLSAIPVTVGIAILKHHLYDIDLLINRTLVYGVLTGTLALVYFGGVTVTQAIFRTLTGQADQPQLAIVVSTLVIAALFNPLRRRIQSFIDRRFYRRKYDAAKTLEAFSVKLRDETDLDALSDDLVGVVRETMQPSHVSPWLRPDTPPKGKQAD
jgi:hypothetical protein